MHVPLHSMGSWITVRAEKKSFLTEQNFYNDANTCVDAPQKRQKAFLLRQPVFCLLACKTAEKVRAQQVAFNSTIIPYITTIKY